jgi:hypothetical protein
MSYLTRLQYWWRKSKYAVVFLSICLLLYVLQNTLKIICYSYFHTIMTYGLIFWVSSTESIRIFRLQKKITRIMKGCKSKQSCRELFYEFGIFLLPTQYIFTLLIFINKNKKKLFITNPESHNYTTKQQTNFHLPLAN